MKFKDIEDIENIVKYAIEELYKNDIFIIKNKEHEASITARIAMYLRDKIEAGNESKNGENNVYDKSNDNKKIVVDCEYNRHLTGQKFVNVEDGKKMRPDIIIHTRGCDDNNILFCEAKKGNLDSDDKIKLDSATKEPYEYKYALGIYNIKPDKITLKWYIKSESQNPIICKYDVKDNKLVSPQIDGE